MWDYLIKDCRVVDPKNHINEEMDVAIEGDKIACVGKDLPPGNAREVLHLPGKILQPGIIDTHLHLGINTFGFKMAALAGVTTCLDMSGDTDFVFRVAKEHGCGLNFAVLQALLPGKNIDSNNPGRDAVEHAVTRVLDEGAFGVKILGGHFPLTPEASRNVIEICNSRQTYVAWHAGTTENGSNILGMKQAVELAEGHFLHLAHINAYCRGYINPVEEETREAIELLETNPNIISESYLSPRNGCQLIYDEQGVPRSGVTRSCLKRFGFAESVDGIEKAIASGVLGVIKEEDGLSKLASATEGLALFREMHGEVSATFDRVNPFLPRGWLVQARRANGRFLVNAIATDGGSIPRNVILELGLSVVKLGGLSLSEFAEKSALNPATMLNLKNKGHLSVGADADITIYDLDKQQAVSTFVLGKPVLVNGRVCSKEPALAYVHPSAFETLKQQGLRCLPHSADYETAWSLNKATQK